MNLTKNGRGKIYRRKENRQINCGKTKRKRECECKYSCDVGAFRIMIRMHIKQKSVDLCTVQQSQYSIYSTAKSIKILN